MFWPKLRRRMCRKICLILPYKIGVLNLCIFLFIFFSYTIYFSIFSVLRDYHLIIPVVGLLTTLYEVMIHRCFYILAELNFELYIKLTVGAIIWHVVITTIIPIYSFVLFRTSICLKFPALIDTFMNESWNDYIAMD